MKVIPEILFKQPYTDMMELQEIQSQFSPSFLSPIATSKFSSDAGVYIMSNDARYTEDYWPRVQESFPLPEPALFTLLYKERQRKQQKKKVALIIGNGNIISLLDQLPVEGVLLLDVEPVVHCFLWYVRSVVLGVKDLKNFTKVKDEVIYKIGAFRYEVKGEVEGDGMIRSIRNEMENVGELHFLASAERFRSCQKALKTKPLLPVKINIFDSEQMDSFCGMLRKGIKVSYINLSNVADYDYERDLEISLRRLPITKHCKIVFTSLCGSHMWDYMNPNPYPNKTFVCEGLEDLFDKLSSYTYKRCRVARHRHPI